MPHSQTSPSLHHPLSIPGEHLPGASLDAAKMPGHWLLARLGKRVLRPGGLELTRAMLSALRIGPQDEVVEFAPGLGVTARLALSLRPAAYTGVERDEAATANVRRLLSGPSQQCLVGTATATGLPDASATVVYGEAMLTMHTAAQKAQIIREAYRLLRPGGRYGVHEMSLEPDTLSEELKQQVNRDLSAAIHVGARPLTSTEWRQALEAEGFQVEVEARSGMLLLELRRLIQDEGWRGTLRILFNTLRDPVALKRVLEMRRIFRRHQQKLAAIILVARKPA